MFAASVICLITACFAIFSDRVLAELIKNLFNSPNSVKSVFFAGIAGGFYVLGNLRKIRKPHLFYSTEAIFFLGVVATAAAVFFFGKSIDVGSGHFSLLILLSCFIYGGVALWLGSKSIWLFSLISLGSWLWAETGYLSGWDAYYLGMSYPLRFGLFGVVLTIFSHSCMNKLGMQRFYRPTFGMGLFYTFVALWLMSIFGNYGEYDAWREVKQIKLLHFALLFALAACAAIYYGLKHDDAMARLYGLTFLFINFYTRFFEYFWTTTHKAIFFGLLGISLWYLGLKAERIWGLGKLSRK